MSSNVPLRQWLRSEVSSRGLTYRELGRLAGLGDTTIERLLNRPDPYKPAPDTLRAIARALGVHERVVLELAGYPVGSSLSDLNPRLLLYLRALQSLPPEDLQIVLDQLRPWVERAQIREARGES